MKLHGYDLEPLAPPGDAGVPAGVRCAFTVDVEDWYQSTVDFDAPISDRVRRNLDLLLPILARHGVRGTFFVQGRVAETYPQLLRDLLAGGHEIQSHGHSHRPLYAMDRAALRRELEAAVKTVEDACGTRVTAFRAADFSIVRGNLWALEVLAEFGFTVDSSIFPLRTSRYGIPGWCAGPHRVGFPGGGSILEVPVAVAPLAGMRVPVGGGGYVRLLPAFVLERAVRAILGRGLPVVLYCHPYEWCPGEMSEYRGRISPLLGLTQSLGRAAFIRRMEHLFTRFRFGRFDECLAGWTTAP